LLDYIGIEKDRFKVDWISAAEANKFATVMNDVLEKVHKLGPNRKLRDARWKR